MRLQKTEDSILQKYKQTLKECSKNDLGEPVTASEFEAYDFDGLSAFEAENYRRKKKLRSADALFLKNLGNMEIYQETFYKKVYTIDVKDFEEHFLDKIYSKN